MAASRTILFFSRQPYHKCSFFSCYNFFLAASISRKSSFLNNYVIFICFVISNILFMKLSFTSLICLELEQAEQDPDLIALSRQFKATAMELISVLEQVNNLSRTLHIFFTCIRFQVLVGP